MIDFTVDPPLAALRDRTRAFIRDVVIPLEPRDAGDGHGLDTDLRRDLQRAARDGGLLSPHVAVEYGGLGLDSRAQSVIFEEAGYSLLGPPALNCAAPDEGNMHLLERVANDAQKSGTCGRSRLATHAPASR